DDLEPAVGDPEDVDVGRLGADLALLQPDDLGDAVDWVVGLVAYLETGLHKGRLLSGPLHLPGGQAWDENPFSLRVATCQIRHLDKWPKLKEFGSSLPRCVSA